jgi:hypothetical protein
MGNPLVIFGIIVLIAAVTFAVWYFFLRNTESTCGTVKYDPTSQSCISDKVCDNTNVCGQSCLDPTSQKCVNNSPCDIANSCDDGTCCASKCCGKDGETKCCSDGQSCVNDACVTDSSGYNCSGGACVKVTDGSTADYTTKQDCIDAACYVKGSGCYTSDVMNLSQIQDNPINYMVVALYGFKQIPDANYGNCDSSLKLVDTVTNKDGTFICVWKNAITTGTAEQTPVFVRCTSLFSGKTYLLRINGGSVVDANMWHTPHIDAQLCDSTGTGDCTTDCGSTVKVSKEFNICLITPSSEKGVLPSAVILSEKDYAGTQCNNKTDSGVNICHTLIPGVESFTKRGKIGWDSAGVL